MIAEISGATTEAVRLALDAASMRQQAIASNIANANTEGYVPLRVNFEEQLGALRRAAAGTESEATSALRGVKPFIEQEPALTGAGPGEGAGGGTAGVMLDMEVVKLSQNVVHYQTLLRALGKQMSIVSAAINEGRRG